MDNTSNRLITSQEWLAIGLVTGLGYFIGTRSFMKNKLEAEKKNCGCGKDPCITYGAEPCGNYGAESFEAEDARIRLKKLMKNMSDEEKKKISKMAQIQGIENTLNEIISGSISFAAPATFDDSEDDDKPSNYEFVRDTSENEFKDDCEICARPFAINKLGQKLIQHYLKESDNGFKEWKNKKNPEGTRRTARNITGFFLYDYGLDALNQYVLFQDKTGISEKVIELLRLSLVERIVAGDVINLIEMMDMQDEVDDTPTFGKGFEKDFMAEN